MRGLEYSLRIPSIGYEKADELSIRVSGITLICKALVVEDSINGGYAVVIAIPIEKWNIAFEILHGFESEHKKESA